MVEIRASFFSFITKISDALNTVRLVDIIDIVIVAFVLYHAVKMVRETRARQLIKGVAAIVALNIISGPGLLDMITLNFLIRNIIKIAPFALVVIFQPELSRALEQVGRTKFTSLGKFSDSAELERQNQEALIEAVCNASAILSAQKTGALMVLEREIKLGEIIKTGTRVDALPSVELINNLFFINSPLHDGAVVMREGRIYAAGCFLPLSSNMEISKELGTRHRAALGMSEVSDAVIVVVSEETGAISVAVDSKLQRKLSVKNLNMLLRAKMLGHDPKEAKTDKMKTFLKVKKQ